MNVCPHCGAEIEEKARFCLYCMASLDEKTPAGAPKRHWVRAGVMTLAGVVFLAAVGWGTASLAGSNPSQTPEASSGIASLTANTVSHPSSRAASSEETVTSETGSDAASSEATTTSEQSSVLPSSAAAGSRTNSVLPSSAATGSGTNSVLPSSAATGSGANSVLPSLAATGSGASNASPSSSISDLGPGIGYTVISETGKTGDCTYTLYHDTGALTISGKGAMADYNLWNNLTPWDSKKLTAVTLEPGLTTVGSWAFHSSKITSVVIPDSVTSIGTQAFIQCVKLTSVTFGKGLKEIGPSAFINCEKLTEIVLPDGCTTIGRSAFKGCESLTHVTIPASVTSIGDFAFLNCNALKRIVIPASVTSIGENILSCQVDSLSEILPMPDVTIITTKGSAAETYARENGISCVSLDSSNVFNGHTYQIVSGSYSWTAAKAKAEALGGHLACITSQAEQDYIDSINGFTPYWLGGYRDNNNNWRWVTGEAFAYTNWAEGEPNNSPNVIANENALALWPSEWNDLNENNLVEQKGFVCEWDFVI